MAYDVTKLAKLGSLKALAERIAADFVAKETGKGLSTNDFSNEYKDKVDAFDRNDPGYLTQHQDITGKADKATSLAGYGIADAYTKTEVNSKLSSVYRFKGSVATYAELPTEDVEVGDTYNVQTAHKPADIKAGDNVAWDGTGWDVLSGVVDLSAYSTTEETMEAVDEMIATDGEVDAMLAEVFG